MQKKETKIKILIIFTTICFFLICGSMAYAFDYNATHTYYFQIDWNGGSGSYTFYEIKDADCANQADVVNHLRSPGHFSWKNLGNNKFSVTGNFSGWTPYILVSNPQKDGYHFTKFLDGTDDMYYYKYSESSWLVDCGVWRGLWLNNSSAWNDANALRADGSTSTLKAIWSPNTYTVVYNGNGNTGGSTASSSHTYGVSKALTTNGFSRVGYTFAGWNTNSSGTGTSYTNSQSVLNLSTTHGGTVNLYAKWTPNTYTVKYNGNGNTGGSTASSSHTYGVSKALTANGFSRTGYTFAGWNTNSSGTGTSYSNQQSVSNLTSTSGGTVNLYAKWTPNTYTVRYTPNGGTCSTSSQSCAYDKTYTYPTPSKSYTVSYNSNGGSACSESNAACTFNGWNFLGSNHKGTFSNLTSTNNGLIDAWASWTGNSVTLPSTTKNGYTFKGWYRDSAFTDYVGAAGEKYTPTKSLTLYAKWELNYYTVTLNKGTGIDTGKINGTETTSAKVAYGSTVTIEVTYPCTYAWKGWNGSGTTYTAKSDTLSCKNKNGATGSETDIDSTAARKLTFSMPAGDVSLSPSGQMKTFTLKYEGLNSSTTPSSVASKTVNAGTNLTVISAPTRSGFEFGGWYASNGGSYISDGIIRMTSDITLTAQWGVKKKEMRLYSNTPSTSSSIMLHNTLEDEGIELRDATADQIEASGIGNFAKIATTYYNEEMVSGNCTMVWKDAYYGTNLTWIYCNDSAVRDVGTTSAFSYWGTDKDGNILRNSTSRNKPTIIWDSTSKQYYMVGYNSEVWGYQTLSSPTTPENADKASDPSIFSGTMYADYKDNSVRADYFHYSAYVPLGDSIKIAPTHKTSSGKQLKDGTVDEIKACNIKNFGKFNSSGSGKIGTITWVVSENGYTTTADLKTVYSGLDLSSLVLLDTYDGKYYEPCWRSWSQVLTYYRDTSINYMASTVVLSEQMWNEIGTDYPLILDLKRATGEQIAKYATGVTSFARGMGTRIKGIWLNNHINLEHHTGVVCDAMYSDGTADAQGRYGFRSSMSTLQWIYAEGSTPSYFFTYDATGNSNFIYSINSIKASKGTVIYFEEFNGYYMATGNYPSAAPRCDNDDVCYSFVEWMYVGKFYPVNIPTEWTWNSTSGGQVETISAKDATAEQLKAGLKDVKNFGVVTSVKVSGSGIYYYIGDCIVHWKINENGDTSTVVDYNFAKELTDYDTYIYDLTSNCYYQLVKTGKAAFNFLTSPGGPYGWKVIGSDLNINCPTGDGYYSKVCSEINEIVLPAPSKVYSLVGYHAPTNDSGDEYWVANADGTGTSYETGTKSSSIPAVSDVSSVYVPWQANTYTFQYNGYDKSRSTLAEYYNNKPIAIAGLSGNSGLWYYTKTYTYDQTYSIDMIPYSKLNYAVTWDTSAIPELTGDTFTNLTTKNNKVFNVYCTFDSTEGFYSIKYHYNDDASTVKTATGMSTLKDVTIGQIDGSYPKVYKDKHEFIGWTNKQYSYEEYEEALNSGTSVTLYENGHTRSALSGTDGDVVDLYGLWKELPEPEPEIVTVIYNGNGADSGTVADEVYEVKSATATAKVSKNQYLKTYFKFKEWNTKADGSGTSYAPDADISLTDESLILNGVITLYAQWTPSTYTITIDPNGGSMAYGSSDVTNKFTQNFICGRKSVVSYVYENSSGVTVTDKYSGLALGEPKRDGYSFQGWSLSGGTGGCLNPSIVNDEIYLSDTNSKYTNKTDMNIYYFNGDYEGNVTATAQWTPSTYNLTIDPNGGSIYNGDSPTTSSFTTTFVYGRTTMFAVPNSSNLVSWHIGYSIGEPIRTGYTFTGWDITNGTLVRTSTDTAPNGVTYLAGSDIGFNASDKWSLGFLGFKGDYIGDVTVTAQWTPITYKNTFKKGLTDSTVADITKTYTYDVYEDIPDIGDIKGRSYTISFEENGGAEEKDITGNLEFKSWLSSDGVAYKPDDKIINGVSPNDTYTAQWDSVTVELPKNPIKSGYKFLGWYDNTSCTGTKVTSLTILPDTTSYTKTLYAKWEAETRSLIYVRGLTDDTTAEVPEATTFLFGSDITLAKGSHLIGTSYTLAFDSQGGTSIDSRSGRLNFTGWEIGNTLYQAEVLLKNPAFNLGIGLNVFATAQYGSVTLDNFGIPTKTGYTFGGWYEDKTCTGSAVTSITVEQSEETFSKTLYAKWTPIQYTVQLYPNKPKDAAASVIKTAPAGFTWNSTNNCYVGTFTYDSTALPASSSVFSLENYIIQSGWYSNENWSGGTAYTNGQKNLTTSNNSTIKLYAGWATNVITVTLDNQEATSTGTKTIYEKYGNGYYSEYACTTNMTAITCPEKTNYTFGGYYTEKNGTGTQVINASGTITAKNTYFAKDTTLYAKWMPNIYTITLNNQSATSAGTEKIYEKYGVGYYSDLACTKSITSITKPSKTGYAFRGYYASTGGKGDNVIAESGSIESGNTYFTKNTTIYANWTPNTYTVVYNGNGATSGSMADEKHTYGTAKNLAANTYKRIYTVTYQYENGEADTTAEATATFHGWATSSTGAKVYDNQASVMNLTATDNSTVNLYANWTLGKVTLPTPKRSGYSFKGWKNGETTYSGGTEYTPVSDVTFVAQWQDDILPTAAINTTNNVATEQTMTLSMADLGSGIVGYYFGTNSDYTKNTYTSMSATANYSTTKRADTNTTYYLTAKDGAGNVSKTVSITFYKTILDANGGSVTLAYVLTANGNSFMFPTATRTGYHWGTDGDGKSSHWATSKTATSGVTSLKVTENSTYYALWEANTYTVYLYPNRPSNPKSINDVSNRKTNYSSWTWDGTNKRYYKSFTYGSTSIGVSPSTMFSLTGYRSHEATKWYTETNTDGSGKGTAYTSSSTNLTSVNGGSVSLYAGWSDNAPTAKVSTTNNIAKSQTVTLSGTDTGSGIASYYWGNTAPTATNISSLAFIAVTCNTDGSWSKDVTVNSTGTWYLVTKDKNGKVSTPEDYHFTEGEGGNKLTFYQTILDGNHDYIYGVKDTTYTSVPSAQISYSINVWNSVISPTATRAGNTFQGWNQTNSAQTANTEITVTSNATYYAIWKDVTKPVAVIDSIVAETSASQKVMFSLYDTKDGGNKTGSDIASYYWGTKATPAAADFVTVSKDSTYGYKKNLTVTVTEAGIYYLFCKDEAGNISNPASHSITGDTGKITFYKITLNANGTTAYPASVSPAYYIAEKNTTITLPAATRVGFHDPADNKDGKTNHYATTSTGTTYYTTWKVVSDQTLYARWTNNTYTVYLYPARPTNPSSFSDVSVLQSSYHGWKWDSSNKRYYKILTFGYKDSTISDRYLNANPKEMFSLTGYSIGESWYTDKNANGIGKGTSYRNTAYDLTSENGATITLYPSWDDNKPETVKITSTNNVAASQTVTLTMEDKGSGIANYYWGTNSDYTKNEKTVVNKGSLTQTKIVDASKGQATYYLTVEDENGKKNTATAVFAKTTIHGNGSTDYPAYIQDLTKQTASAGNSTYVTTMSYKADSTNSYTKTATGNMFTFPRASRVGYHHGTKGNSDYDGEGYKQVPLANDGPTFYGYSLCYSTSVSGSGSKTVTPISDAAYYAQWEVNHYTVTGYSNLGTTATTSGWTNGSDSTLKDGYTTQIISTVKSGAESYKLPNAPVRSGYVFKGWMVYSYSDTTGNTNPVKELMNYTVSTVTDPLKNMDMELYNVGSSQSNFSYVEGTKLTYVAVWEHSHPLPAYSEFGVSGYHTSATNTVYAASANSPAYIFESMTASYEPTVTKHGYYINTNKLNRVTLKSTWMVDGNTTWYHMVEKGFEVEKGTAAILKSAWSNTYTAQEGNTVFPVKEYNKNDITFAISGEPTVVYHPYCTMKCTWTDNYSKDCTTNNVKTYYPEDTSKNATDYVRNGKFSIIGDNTAPEISGMEKLLDISYGLDITKLNSYLVSIKGTETNPYASGLSSSDSHVYITIDNLDNGQSITLSKSETKDAYNRITKYTWQTLDLTKKGINNGVVTQDNILNGDFNVTYKLTDNVGNSIDLTNLSKVYSMKLDLKSQTYTPTNYDGDAVLFKKGEAGNLTVTTTGYANALKLEFPSEWYVSKDYPLYLYWGDPKAFDQSKLKEVKSSVFYLDTSKDGAYYEQNSNGDWELHFIFLTPLYAEKGNGGITVTAYKGDVSVIDNSQIKINVDETGKFTNPLVMKRTVSLKISAQSLLGDVVDKIKKTY